MMHTKSHTHLPGCDKCIIDQRRGAHGRNRTNNPADDQQWAAHQQTDLATTALWLLAGRHRSGCNDVHCVDANPGLFNVVGL